MAALLVFIGVVSAFINNTAAVAIFIPVMMSISARVDISPSKLLMPLSFAGMFGGVCTLIGTSTNILVSSIAIERGLDALGMFEFTGMGLIFLVSGLIFLFAIGIKMIPERRAQDDLTAGVVLTAAFGFTSIVVSAIVSVVLMILTGCLKTNEAYEAVNWKVIMLLAGVLPLGTAMDKTGTAELLANLMILGLADFGPTVLMSGFFLITLFITAVMSNNASAALLAPIAIQSATTMGVAPEPFLYAVTFAASLSLITPFGYQTNTMIYGPGQYKVADFFKIGILLNLMFWILATIFIPIIWPF